MVSIWIAHFSGLELCQGVGHSCCCCRRRRRLTHLNSMVQLGSEGLSFSSLLVQLALMYNVQQAFHSSIDFNAYLDTTNACS